MERRSPLIFKKEYMNILKKISIWTLCLMPMWWGACTDDVEVQEHKEAQLPTLVPLKFSVAEGVSLDVQSIKTRAAVSDVSERSLVGEAIGLFIMLDTDYERVQQGLPLCSGYRYVNVKGIVQADGSISVEDTTLFYPLYQLSKVSVVAYAPYREGLDESVLYEGRMLTLQDDQTTGEGVLENDLLLGYPIAGNPFRNTLSDNVTPQVASIAFSHAFSSIRVTLEMPADDISMQCDSIFIALKNVPLRARVNLLTGQAEGLAESVGTIHLLAASYINGLRSNDVITFQASGIAFPQGYDVQNPPQFVVTLKGRPGLPDATFERTETHGADFRAGHEVRYSIHLDGSSD